MMSVGRLDTRSDDTYAFMVLEPLPFATHAPRTAPAVMVLEPLLFATAPAFTVLGP